jgi:hypothetical protein
MVNRDVARSWSKERILLEISELKEEIQKTKAYYAEWRRDLGQYTYAEAKRLGLALISDNPGQEARTISALESDIEFLKGLL